jgi:peroxiredoxin
MLVFALISSLLLWVAVFVLGFLLVGALRALAFVRWRLEQLEATTPSRVGRRGLRRGAQAPGFTLPCVEGQTVSLQSFAGRKVFLVFMQSHCMPCHQIIPELNRLQQAGDIQVVAIMTGGLEAARTWRREVQARFPVLIQEERELSRRYEVYATPFAFLIDDHGVIISRGIVTKPLYINYVLSGMSPETPGQPPEASTTSLRRDSPVCAGGQVNIGGALIGESQLDGP